MKTFLLSLSFAASVVALSAQPAPTPGHEMMRPETISVTGTGRSTIAPDRVTFTLGVQTVAPTVDQAVSENNQRIASVIAALKKGGAADKEIRTSNFSVYPQQDYSQQSQLPRITGYQVVNNITVTRENVTDAGRLLQAAVNAGVNTASGLTFLVSDPARGRSEGLKAAFDDARARATILAQAAGRSVGRALMIDEGSPAQPGPRPMAMQGRAMMAKADVGEVPVEAGDQEQSYSVSVVFEMR
jgi:uncharacterized protein YggE